MQEVDRLSHRGGEKDDFIKMEFLRVEILLWGKHLVASSDVNLPLQSQ